MWWPNGYGKQKLYHLMITYECQTLDLMRNRRSIKVIRIGFRTIELIQEPQSQGDVSFKFKVNDIDIFVKGANWISSNILPENTNDEAHLMFLLRAAKQSHMNMLRVWGGGIYEHDDFYDIADNFGILIWHDMMFTRAMYPVNDEFIESVKIEIEQNIRRLQKHPSIAIWTGNDACDLSLYTNRLVLY